jgi:lysophospholipase L1-like esterase
VVRLLLVFGGVATAVLVAEVVLRLVSAVPYPYSVWPAHLNKVFRPDPRILPGISGESRFWTSSAGLRGDEFSSDQRYRILVFGGSAAECLYLDQDESWPQILQQRLTETTGRRVWVGNAAVSGRSSPHHVVQVERLLPQYPRIDGILLFVGVNDFLKRLEAGDRYTPEMPQEELMSWAFYHRPFGWSVDATAIARLYARERALRRFRREPLFQDEMGRVYARWRERRRAASRLIDELPDLSVALAAYARNLTSIIDRARASGAEVVLVTQPSLWRPDLGSPERDLLWTGGIGNYRRRKGSEYYSVEALAAGMARFNQRLLAVCRERAALCIDLAPRIPKDTGAFYDDVHFNEQGARAVADALFEDLLPIVAAGVRRAG